MSKWEIDGRKVVFHHMRSKPEKGGITVAMFANDMGASIAGVAVCGERDNFCYATGRTIAFGRLLKLYQQQKVQS